jgi:Fibronectin type III domain
MVVLRRVFLLLSIGAALAAPAPASADSLTPLPECGTGIPAAGPPCVEGVKRNGTTIPYDAPFEGGEDLVTAEELHITGDPTRRFQFLITSEDGQFTLAPADLYELTLNLGPGFTGETFARGHNVVVMRSTDVGGNALFTFEQNPVRASDDSCTGAGVCLMTATRTSTGYLDGHVDDLAYLTDPDDAVSMRGFDLASNIDWISSPLELDYVTNSIFVRVANAHFEVDGSTVFQGFVEFKLPFSMLRRLYDVDDPASLTASAFSVSGAGAAATTDVTVDGTGHNVHVQLEGLTFSKRKLHLNGNTTPGAPRELRAVRKSASAGVLKFKPALPRGSRVRGYEARCVSGGGHVRTGASLDSPLRVTGLFAGVSYSCKVRAKSKAGLGKAARDTMPRR